MRTLHLVATFGRGGIASSLWHLLPALNKQAGNEVSGAVFYEKGWFGELLEDEGISLEHLQMSHKYDPRVLLKLIRLFKGHDIVHAHGWPIIFFVALASLFVSKPQFVLSEHSVTNGRRRPLFKWFDRWIYSRFDQIVAVSGAVADSLEQWQPQIAGKITVIYNGINSAYFQTAEPKAEIRRRLNLDESTPVIFASGNFRFAKGFDLLLQSMAELVDKFSQAGVVGNSLPVLVITGEGVLQQSMAELAEQLGLADQVRFLGFRTDMPEILRAADLFVLSSRWEGCPMVVLESMGLGVPILATDVGGVPELIFHDQTGIIIPPGNSTTMSDGLYELLHDSERAACLAEQGQERLIRMFSSEKSANGISALYRQMVGLAI